MRGGRECEFAPPTKKVKTSACFVLFSRSHLDHVKGVHQQGGGHTGASSRGQAAGQGWAGGGFHGAQRHGARVGRCVFLLCGGGGPPKLEERGKSQITQKLERIAAAPSQNMDRAAASCSTSAGRAAACTHRVVRPRVAPRQGSTARHTHSRPSSSAAARSTTTTTTATTATTSPAAAASAATSPPPPAPGTIRVVILGGTGRVGSATAAALLAGNGAGGAGRTTRALDLLLVGRDAGRAAAATAALREAAASTPLAYVTSPDALASPAALAPLLAGAGLLIHCAGPFQAGGGGGGGGAGSIPAPLAAAIAAGIPYVDVCDDPEWAQASVKWRDMEWGWRDERLKTRTTWGGARP